MLTHDPGMYPKRLILDDARLAGMPILPVDVNASAADWRVEPVGQLPGEGLRPGLREVKGISEAEVARIVAGQPYTSLRDLWERAAVSRPVAERLVLVGALDALYARWAGRRAGGTADAAACPIPARPAGPGRGARPAGPRRASGTGQAALGFAGGRVRRARPGR